MLTKLSLNMYKEGIEADIYWWVRELTERQVNNKVCGEILDLLDLPSIEIDMVNETIKLAI